MDIKELINNSKLNISKEKIMFNEPMNKHTTFKIGGPAECLINIDNKEDLKEIIDFAKQNKIEINIIGNGSNILVLDDGIKGITLKIRLDYMEIQKNKQNVHIKLGSGVKNGKIARYFLDNSITGFEELSGIPGTIGGAIIMNAGAYGKEIKDIIEKVKCIDYNGNEIEFLKEDLKFEYRNSFLKNKNFIITEVEMNLKIGNKQEIKNKMDEYLKSRKEKQPTNYPNAGSTFKRGKDFITAKLIDEAGLKGYQIGGACISTKHSGFIVNKGNATAQDVLDLVKYVKETIYEKFEKEIQMEIEIMGQIHQKSN